MLQEFVNYFHLLKFKYSNHGAIRWSYKICFLKKKKLWKSTQVFGLDPIKTQPVNGVQIHRAGNISVKNQDLTSIIERIGT